VVSLGLKAIEAGYRVLFSSAAHFIATLATQHHRRHRSARRDREDPRTVGPARAGATAFSGARDGVRARGLIKKRNNGSATGPSLAARATQRAQSALA